MIYSDTLGAKERKLILLMQMDGTVVEVWPENGKKYKLNDTFFTEKDKVLLIGLDGGVKYRSEKAFSKKKLFSLIDSMPMRAAEIRNKDYE